MAKFTKIVRVISHGLTISGIALSGRSIMHPNPAFDREMQEKGAIVLEARQKYGVGQECATGFGGFGTTVCVDRVNGNGTKAQKDRILRQYNEEIAQRQALVPVNREANEQAERDGLGLLIGIPTTALGLLGSMLTAETKKRKGKQFQNRIERRGGRRRKEGM